MQYQVPNPSSHIIPISTVNSVSQRARGVFRQNEEHILEVAWLHKSQQGKKSIDSLEKYCGMKWAAHCICEAKMLQQLQ